MNETLQREILEDLDETYPNETWFGDQISLSSDQGKEMYYLNEHGLIDARIERWTNAEAISSARLTAKGRDFIHGCGLSAYYGTITVKLHQDTIRELIEARILALDATQQEKDSMLKTLKKLPADAIKTATQELTKKALEGASLADIGRVISVVAGIAGLS